jgi:Caspase domain/Sel1 repeat
MISLMSILVSAASLDEGVSLFKSRDNLQAFEILSYFANAGDPTAQGLLARMYENGWGVKQNKQEAFNWAKKGLEKNDPASQLVMGELAYQNEVGLKRDKAIYWLTKAAKQNYAPAFQALLRISLKDLSKTKITTFINDLAQRKTLINTKLLLELYQNQEFIPEMRLKVVRYALESIQKGSMQSSGYIVDIASDIQLPKVLKIAWLKQAINSGLREYSSQYQSDIEGLSDSEIENAKSMPIRNLIVATENYIQERQSKYGAIEAADLISEGWIQFVGQRGVVNEPLAQYLMEEGLRIAIRTKNQHLIDEARSELGVVLGAAVNQNVRNPRLAEVHITEGKQSDDHVYNMLWYDYEGKVDLTSSERVELQKIYKDANRLHQDHITVLLGPLPSSMRNNPVKIINFLKEKYKSDPNPELAYSIADMIEDNHPNQNLAEALHWYQVYQDTSGTDSDERLARMKRVMNGQYIRDTPDLRNAIESLFNVNAKAPYSLESNPAGAIKKSPLVMGAKVYALVVGNSTYKNNALPNGTNDSNAVAAKFESLGFNVTRLNNLNRKSFIKGLIDFSEKSKDSDVTIFYYSGHGLQLGGVNYLLPVDIDLNSSSEIVASEGMNLNDILRRSVLGARRIVFLDACRTNPFKASPKSGPSLGLAPVNTSSNTLISFAARDGGVALDSVGGRNSPYTEALVSNLDKDEDIEILLRSVRDDVMNATKGKQEPVEFGSLRGGKIILSRLAK